MKKVCSKHELTEEMKTQAETVKALGDMLQKMEVNDKVVNANIHELFVIYNEAFFNGKLDSVLLEWSDRMTLCAGICYYNV